MLIRILILIMLMPISSFASLVTTPYVYSVGDTVTNVKLNANQNAITNVVNGGLDNTNVNTSGGYRLFQTVAVLPSAGSQGAVYFLTSDNSLNFDNGSSFSKSVSVNSPASGNVPYYTSSWGVLSVGTSANNIVQLDSSAKLPAVDGSALTGLTASIKDYGSSLTTGTTKLQSALKIVYGRATLSSGDAQVTGLPFTSSSSYQVTLTRIKTTDLSQEVQIKSYDSGSAFTIRDGGVTNDAVSWIAIGT